MGTGSWVTGTGWTAVRQGADETISPAWECFYKSGTIGSIAQHSPKPGDSVSDAVLEIDERVCRPEFRAQLLGGKDLARSPQQHGQHL
jgi:hypothetical protein